MAIVYSLNAPVPSAVARLAADLAGELPAARARARGTRTLVVKRLSDGGESDDARLEARAREALAGAPACGARVDGVDVFEDVHAGPAPVVYLAVESPGLGALHGRLCEAFEPVAGIEGEEYVPHVTVARGGSVDAARRLAATDVDPIEWTVEELQFWDATREQSVSRVSLPA